MTTAAERLVQIAGTTGTAATLLLLIGSGATAGAALVDYSGLASATAAQHLLSESAVAPAPTFSGGARYPIPVRPLKRKPKEEDEALLLALLH